MTHHRYRISGMVVASELVLAGAMPLEEADGQPDVFMRAGPVPRFLANATISRPGWDAEGDRFLLRGPGIGRFLLTGGSDVVFEPEPGVSVDACAVYLQGTVIGALLHQRGGIVLHASGVEADGGAVLFTGASGEGKSTLAATLSVRGAPLVADDVSLISFDGGDRPLVSTDARRLKLTSASIHASGLEAMPHDPVQGLPDKAYVSPPTSWTRASLPLRAVYVLRSAEIATPTISPLPAALALAALNANAHRPAIVRHTGQARRYFEASARILAYVPVFALDRPRNLSQLAETADTLTAHWRTLGQPPSKEV